MPVPWYSSSLVVQIEVLLSDPPQAFDKLACVLDSRVVFVDSPLESLDVFMPFQLVLDHQFVSFVFV